MSLIAIRENVNIISRTVNKTLKEGVSKCTAYRVQVTEGNLRYYTQPRVVLAEAVADLEEILQFHDHESVVLEARIENSKGNYTTSIQPASTPTRNPIISDSSILFRFRKNAELFAEELNNCGVTCKLQPHNWGTAVKPTKMDEQVLKIYRMLAERKWIKKALEPSHRGDCTPMSKASCTPAKKALAKRFKRGGDLYSGGKDDVKESREIPLPSHPPYRHGMMSPRIEEHLRQLWQDSTSEFKRKIVGSSGRIVPDYDHLNPEQKKSLYSLYYGK